MITPPSQLVNHGLLFLFAKWRIWHKMRLMPKDKFSENLFEKPEVTDAPETLENGEYTDEEGNVHDASGQLLREAQSEDLKRALKAAQAQHPREKITPDDPLVQQYIRDFRRERDKGNPQ